MGTVTYPDQRVQEVLSEHFSCFKLNLLDKHPDYREAAGSGKVIFAPTFLFTDAKGREIRRYLGWLPPESFLGELGFVLGMHRFNQARFLEARDTFQQTLDHHPEADVAAETLYWLGIAAFLGGKKDSAALATAWNEVRARFPESTWATRASVIDDVG